ncbi:MAG TPA: DUF3536 domain-containing protein, partial [Acidimicrobiales bacterium]|nr:DUF3536 domain-containing protein [Acidimicrobiales bacterium]
RMVDGDGVNGGGIAQAYNHVILPLADERDVRTQVRWGLADFRHRFGRRAEGMWLPETAVNDAVLRVLAEEGVRFTVLAPSQAARHRSLAHDTLLGSDEPWTEASNDSPIDSRRTYRWCDPDDATGERHIDIVFYDGALSHDVAFGMNTTSAQVLVNRVRHSGDGLVCIATDGETFGHHHHFAERALAYALPVEAPRAGVTVTTIAAHLDAHPPTRQVQVHESAWSCVHGVGRWKDDCGCSTGGSPGAQQRWREPLRHALDLLRDHGREVFERRAPDVLRDPWHARDEYVDVLLGDRTIDDFVNEHVVDADPTHTTDALTLLEQQRHAMLMYTSCGWFFWDLAGLETVQILRYAARAMDLLAELGETPPTDAFLEVLAKAESNQPGEGNGRDVWRRHVLPGRVDERRVVAHLALADLLGQREPSGAIAVFDVAPRTHVHLDRGNVALCAGTVDVVHRRTRRRTTHTYAALHLGGLEVTGAVRAGEASVDAIKRAFERGERVTTLLRSISDEIGPFEFGLEAALPDAADELVASASHQLEDVFGAGYERLFDEHRATFRSLAVAGYPLPDELRVAAEVAFDRRLTAELDDGSHESAIAVAAEALETGVRIDAPRPRAALATRLESTVRDAVAGDADAADAALVLLRLAAALGIVLDLRRVQELVYDALTKHLGSQPPTSLALLGAAIGLAVERLGSP